MPKGLKYVLLAAAVLLILAAFKRFHIGEHLASIRWETFLPRTSADLAAWLQAGGSLLALAVAIWSTRHVARITLRASSAADLTFLANAVSWVEEIGMDVALYPIETTISLLPRGKRVRKALAGLQSVTSDAQWPDWEVRYAATMVSAAAWRLLDKFDAIVAGAAAEEIEVFLIPPDDVRDLAKLQLNLARRIDAFQRHTRSARRRLGSDRDFRDVWGQSFAGDFEVRAARFLPKQALFARYWRAFLSTLY